MFILILFNVKIAKAQETPVITGGELTGSGGTISYSIGQLSYIPITGNTGTISQGVQQSIEIFILSDTEFETLDISAITYPNPVIDRVMVKLDNKNLKNLTYRLYDMRGKAINEGAITKIETPINLNNTSSGIYILKINQGNKALKSFKIVKK